jgi:hypothetical protein
MLAVFFPTYSTDSDHNVFIIYLHVLNVCLLQNYTAVYLWDSGINW